MWSVLKRKENKSGVKLFERWRQVDHVRSMTLLATLREGLEVLKDRIKEYTHVSYHLLILYAPVHIT
jgi:hypothetical protein